MSQLFLNFSQCVQCSGDMFELNDIGILSGLNLVYIKTYINGCGRRGSTFSPAGRFEMLAASDALELRRALCEASESSLLADSMGKLGTCTFFHFHVNFGGKLPN